MEIFNIHIFEFLLIAALALVVFGPERLPEVGRFIGKQVARFLAWQQQSPELKMINDVRAEFEQEIAGLRDELVRTRKQLDLSQEVNLNSIRDELRPMLNLRDQPKAKGAGNELPSATSPTTTPEPAATAIEPAAPATSDQAFLEEILARPDPDLPPAAEPAPVAGEAAPPPAAMATSDLDPTPLQPEPAPRPVPEGTVQSTARPNRLAGSEPTTVLEQRDERLSYLEQRRRSRHDPPDAGDPPPAASPNGQQPTPVAPTGDPAGTLDGRQPATAEEIRLLMQRIESLSADLQALISGLQAEGVIGVAWQPEAAISEQESLSR